MNKKNHIMIMLMMKNTTQVWRDALWKVRIALPQEHLLLRLQPTTGKNAHRYPPTLHIRPNPSPSKIDDHPKVFAWSSSSQLWPATWQALMASSALTRLDRYPVLSTHTPTHSNTHPPTYPHRLKIFPSSVVTTFQTLSKFPRSTATASHFGIFASYRPLLDP